ncbi:MULTISPECIES: AAA family ATPase [unclassified Rhodococcus (in: high G+C Gram-positive bacteria)]|uniref:AAA family ATPase n=1 Tax=unclassified Rhodococcus (in: high G+C Gram-positive bacteria) TaxID=192944 RepID=UPI001446E64F|nr:MULTISPECIES: AAA family ATPase [unclassified Rhodococcus (in: high G+C Gram-positive bacteria)]
MSVDEIKDFRIFHKWKPGHDAPELDHVTLVHANNGSGKSTLASLLNPTTSASGWDAGVSVTIDEAGSTRQVTSPDDPCWQNVVVFNHDYVENAVRIKSGTTKALLALGPDSVQRQSDLERAQAELETVAADLANSQNSVTRAERLLSTRAKAAADEINTSLAYRYGRGYNAANVKKEIETGLDDAVRKGIDENALLSRACATEKECLQPLPTTPPPPPVSVHTIRVILSEVPVVSHGERTDLTPRARDWLETGTALHNAEDSCMFCTGTVTQGRLTELQTLLTHAENSLSERARRMAQQLKTYLDTVQQWMSALPRSNAGVYDDLGKTCTSALDTARISGEQLHFAVTNAHTALTAKAEDVHTNPTFEIPTVGSIEINSDADRTGIDSEWPTLVIEPLQGVITEHNARTAAFASEKTAAAKCYKLFVLGTHQERYRAAHASVTAAREQQQTLTEESTRLNVLVGDLSGGEFDPGPGVKWLNDELRRLLGRDELQLQVLDDRNYSITRYGAKVDHLSEGEKTALALLHFLGSLDDKGRGTQNLCVVIDDPISSLDSDIAFGASAVLWGNLLGRLSCRCGHDEHCTCRTGKRMRVDQLILFTHNFDFFRHWSNQLDRLPPQLFKNNSGLSYVQLELRPRWRTATAATINRRRTPEWSTFGATGRPYKGSGPDVYKERTRLRSEYHYLFARCATALTTLNIGSATYDEQMDAEALLPNASRRLLEGFLAHRHPEKMGGRFRDSLKAGIPHNADNPTRVVLDTYLNRYSHNEEATMGTPLHRPETAKMLAFVFDYLHRLDPRHFHGMCIALGLDPHKLLPPRATPYSHEELAGRTLCMDTQCPLTSLQDIDARSDDTVSM